MRVRGQFGRVLLIVLIGLSMFCAGSLPTDSAMAKSYVIVSPNTRSTLSDEDARLSVDSFEQKNEIAVADRVACALAHPVHIGNALGIYLNSSENSVVIETNLGAELTNYTASLLGRYAHQQYVLFFVQQQNGKDRMWIIATRRSFAEVVNALRTYGLVPATVRQKNNGIEIIFVDFGSRSGDKVGALAAALDGSTWVATGVGALPGNDDRTAAVAIFDTNVHEVEKHWKYRLSSHLWTENWHDATSRSCSTEIPFEK